jgi:hypothetical protein
MDNHSHVGDDVLDVAYVNERLQWLCKQEDEDEYEEEGNERVPLAQWLLKETQERPRIEIMDMLFLLMKNPDWTYEQFRTAFLKM